MKIGIDASRCKSGGAISHLKGIISNLDPIKNEFSEIHIWTYQRLSNDLPNFNWLIKHSPKFLNKSLLFQIFWQTFLLKKNLKYHKCDILYTLDASSFCNFSPSVSMSRDMLSYEKSIMKLYGFSLARLRLILILHLQNWTLRRSNGVIFLTKYAAEVIQQHTGLLKNFTIIHHGVSDNFRKIELNNSLKILTDKVINCLYVSNTSYYKNQWNVVLAVEMLRSKGYNIQLILVGGGKGKPQRILERQMRLSDPSGIYIKQHEFVSQASLPLFLSKADIFIFASSCENMPNTLVEGMAAGLPIVCSDRGPMPEVLKDGGVYFNPIDPYSISKAIEITILNENLRKKIAETAKHHSENYTWSKTAENTILFIKKTFQKSLNNDK